jgi:hypothetical protein
MEAAGLLEPPDDLAAHMSAEVRRSGLELGRAWAKHEEFSRAGLPQTASSLLGDLDPTEIARKALALPGASVERPLLALQNTLQDEVLKASSLASSIPALILEEQVGALRHKLEIPEISQAIEGFRETASRLQPEHIWSLDPVRQLGELANLLDLPYLGGAARQWSAILQEPLMGALGTVPLLDSTLSAIAASARDLAAGNIRSVIERCEQLLESETSKHPDRKLPPWVRQFLQNLLFFLLGLAHNYVNTAHTTTRLDQIQETQGAIEEALTDDQEGRDTEREARSAELAAIRAAISRLAEGRDEDAGISRHIRITSENLRLRVSPSIDAEVLLAIPRGSAVQVVEEADGWCRVWIINFASGDSVEGWVTTEFLTEWPTRSKP